MKKPDNTGPEQTPNEAAPVADSTSAIDPKEPAKRPREIGGPSGPEPTRYGDWERNGRVSDF